MYKGILAILYITFVFSTFALHNKLYTFVFYRLPVLACNVAVMHTWDHYI